jgi:hypothetical protein
VQFQRPGGLDEQTRDLIEHYQEDGFAIVRGFFSASEVRTIAAAADRVHAEGVAHGRSFRHGNLFYNVAEATEGAPPIVRMAQWFAYHQPVLNAVRLDTRFADLLGGLLGGDLKQIINQIHWKSRTAPAISPGIRMRASAARLRRIATLARLTSRPASRSIRIRPRAAACG